MISDEIKIYDELDDEQKEIIDSFRELKLKWDYSRFSLYNYQLEDLICDYEKLKELRKSIQVKYMDIYDTLVKEDLIDDDIDLGLFGIAREYENEVWTAEMQTLNKIKMNFDIAIRMIETGEAKKSLIEAENC